MTSDAPTVTDYLAEVPEKRIAPLQQLRQLCIETLTGYKESMRYKMPSYSKNGVVEVAFASQKQHICVYILKHDVMLANAAQLKGLNHGKGCIRYGNPKKIDFDFIKKLLVATVESDSAVC